MLEVFNHSMVGTKAGCRKAFNHMMVSEGKSIKGKLDLLQALQFQLVQTADLAWF